MAERHQAVYLSDHALLAARAGSCASSSAPAADASAGLAPRSSLPEDLAATAGAASFASAAACLGAGLAAFAPHQRCCARPRAPPPPAALRRLALAPGSSAVPLPDSLLRCAIDVVRAGASIVRRSRPDAALGLAALAPHVHPGAVTE